MTKRRNTSSPALPAQSELPAPEAKSAPVATVATADQTPAAVEPTPSPSEAPEAQPTTATVSDLDRDGHDDATGRFVAGNTEGADLSSIELPLSDIEANLNNAVAELLGAAKAFAQVVETPQFVLIDGYRLQFAGHDLMTLTVN